MFEASVASFVFVVLAEMGDKTQLLAMAFACRYRWQTVMWGVLAATAANHLMAAAAGKWLATVVPLDIIRAAAGASFVVFGLWTLRGDTLHEEDKRFNFSPFWTVTVAFFIAEMGDKTQLATIALAVRYNMIIAVWVGTTLGMVISNGFGIIVGMVMGKHIPEGAVKWAAAIVFMAFGVFGLYESLPRDIWSPALVAGGAALLVFLSWFMARAGTPGRKIPVCDPVPGRPSETKQEADTTD